MFRTFKITLISTGETHETQNYFILEKEAAESVKQMYYSNIWAIELLDS